MRYALILLLALLPATAHARTVRSGDNPGPWSVRSDRPACQNLMDFDDLTRAHILRQRDRVRAIWARLSDPVYENDDRHCIKLPRGARVTVTKRTGTYECVLIHGQPQTNCYWAEGITPANRIPFPDADWYLW